MLTWFSAALLLPFLFLLFFFFDCATLHSPPCCSRGSDGKWVVMVVRANTTGSCLARASGVGRPPLRLSSMALMIGGPSSSTFFSRAAKRSLDDVIATLTIISFCLTISALISAAVVVLKSYTRSTGMSRAEQVILRFSSLDYRDATEMFDFSEAIDSSSSDLVRVLQNPSRDDGPASVTVAGARNTLFCLSADLNFLFASPGAETDPGAWRSTPEWPWS
jgi:hypothetical protein